MKVSELQAHLWQSWLKEAKDTLYSVSKSMGVDLNSDAKNWGGCFYDLPVGVTYNQVTELVDEFLIKE